MGNADRPEDRRFPWGLLLLVLLPVLYLASVGPLLGLNARGVIPEQTWETLCMTVYAPLVWLDMETEFFDTPPGLAYRWYLELFEP